MCRHRWESRFRDRLSKGQGGGEAFVLCQRRKQRTLGYRRKRTVTRRQCGNFVAHHAANGQTGMAYANQ